MEDGGRKWKLENIIGNGRWKMAENLGYGGFIFGFIFIHENLFNETKIIKKVSKNGGRSGKKKVGKSFQKSRWSWKIIGKLRLKI